MNETTTRTLWGGLYAAALVLIVVYGPRPFVVFSAVAAVYTAREIGRMQGLGIGLRVALAAYAIAGFYLGMRWSGATMGPSEEGASGYLWTRALVPFLLIWASDSFAYVGGRWLGKTPLAPRISPKKTWEGAAFGAAGVVATAGLASWIWPGWSGPWSAWGLGLAIAVAAPLGDLLESWAKRRAGVKDSGVFLPGHGGWFDRLDSYLLVAWVLGLAALLHPF